MHTALESLVPKAHTTMNAMSECLSSLAVSLLVTYRLLLRRSVCDDLEKDLVGLIQRHLYPQVSIVICNSDLAVRSAKDAVQAWTCHFPSI